jgi:hypothetical protein
VLSFSSQDSVLEKDGFTLYRFNLKDHARALLNPLNWGMVARTLSLLGPHHLGMKRLITECVKAVLIDRIATRPSESRRELLSVRHEHAAPAAGPALARQARHRADGLRRDSMSRSALS